MRAFASQRCRSEAAEKVALTRREAREADAGDGDDAGLL
jgi:hypothetical protein